MSNEGGWMMAWRWRMWTFGLFFGPEVWGVALGPLSVGYAPVLRPLVDLPKEEEQMTKIPLSRDEISGREDELEWVDIPQSLLDDLNLVMVAVGRAYDVLMSVARDMGREDLSVQLADTLSMLAEALEARR